MEIGTAWRTALIDLSQVEEAFSFEDGYSWPDWPVILKAIGDRVVSESEWEQAATEAAIQWMMRLKSELGGDYWLSESGRFLLLTELAESSAEKILAYAEKTLSAIRQRLGEAAGPSGPGKSVLLLFSEDDDYYQYVSHFHRDGTHPGSSGSLLSNGYVHIAAPYEPFGTHMMLAHELTHQCVAHLPLPLWLNEGLAQIFARSVAANPGPLVDHELKERHLSFWNASTIQEFWAGTSFDVPGDSNRLSYNLSEILLTLLLEGQRNWSVFLQQADWRDAGQTAALDCFGRDLGDVASAFLGEGGWRPGRKEIAWLRDLSDRKSLSSSSNHQCGAA